MKLGKLQWLANKHLFDSSDILLEHIKTEAKERKRKTYLMVWNERVSRGKEMSTSLDTEHNRHEYYREKKEKHGFDESHLKFFYKLGTLISKYVLKNVLHRKENYFD